MRKEDFQIRARFRHAVRSAGMPDGARALVAVSGGCDSVFLLRLCLDEAPQRSWHLTVGHVDHSLRPDSAGDAAWVRALARDVKLPFHGLRVRPSHWNRAHGRSLEEEARRLRRRALRRMAREAEADWILLGHTLDDQAETLLLNLFRGSGLRGLGGISPLRPPWFHPLLSTRRSEIREAARRRGLAWREDPSNADPRFLRNRLRAKVLPFLEEQIGGAVPTVLARTAGTLRPVRRFLEEEGRRALAAVRIPVEHPSMQASGIPEPIIRLERLALASYHRAVVEEVLRSAYGIVRGSPRDLKRAHLAGLARAVRTGGAGVFHLPAGIEAGVNRREVVFRIRTKESRGGSKAR